MITDKQILQHIARQPKGTAGFKQLVRELGLRGSERHELDDRLRGMRRRGELLEIGRGRYTLPNAATNKNLAVGRLSMHRDGYGFVTPQNDELRHSIEGDVYIPPNAVGMAMHGDIVLVEVGERKPGGRAEGRIVKVADRKHATVVGTFHYGDKAGKAFNFVSPIDEKITHDVIIPAGMEIPGEEEEETEDEGPAILPRRFSGKRQVKSQTPHRVIGAEARRKVDPEDLEGVVMDVRITQWPTHTQPARGRVIEILGYEDDFGVDVEIIIRKHHIPHIFPAEVLREAQDIHPTVSHKEIERRQDYRALPIVTIDGETARDFDDAVFARELENGNFELQVHIADVAQYVTEDSELDDEARLRGTSVYFPDRAVPMLPLELSTDICSLRPHVERLVLSCIMEIDRAGEVVNYHIHEGVIRSAARMTYNSVQAVLDGDLRTRNEYEALIPEIERMKTLAELLNRKRIRRGSIDFDLPEPIIEFDEQGEMERVTRSERKFAHRLIEEFMLAANECVAGYLDSRDLASLYRIHEKPDPKKIYDFEMLAVSFGYSLGVGALPVKKVEFYDQRRNREGGRGRPRTIDLPQEVHITPRMYQKLTQKIAGTPEERILSFLMLRSLKQARYSEINDGHFALAATTYTHFTSPIRRYPDLIVHRILKAVLAEQSHNNLSGNGDDMRGSSPWSKQQRGDDRHAGRRRSKHQQQIADQHRDERSGPIAEHILHDIAEESSQTERRADEAERELMEWKKVKFMRDRVGEEFDALVTSVTKFGFFVELTDMFIEGLVPLQSLTDDHYTFRENTRQIIGERWGKQYSIGDRVRVLLDRIDQMQRKLQFAIVEEERKPGRAANSDKKSEKPKGMESRSGKPAKKKGDIKRRR